MEERLMDSVIMRLMRQMVAARNSAKARVIERRQDLCQNWGGKQKPRELSCGFNALGMK